MKKNIIKYLFVLSLLAMVLAFPTQTAEANTRTAANTVITILNPPPGGVLNLAVGESYTFEILVESGTPFLVAMALPDQYYPGRGVFYAGSDTANNTNSAVLQLTVTGKSSTADLPGGFAPISVAVAARYQGGITDTALFDFQVFVP